MKLQQVVWSLHFTVFEQNVTNEYLNKRKIENIAVDAV